MEQVKEEARGEKGLMTQGVIWKQLLAFSVPLLLGNLFQLLYNTVDSVVVGNYVGGNALAAVGASNPIVNLLVGLFTGLAVGAGVVISRCFGAGDVQGVRDAVHTSMALALASGAAMTVIGALLSGPLLRLIDTPPEVLPGATSYLFIYFLGILPMMVYNMGSGILRAVGDSRTPLYYLIAASVLNILLDLAFILGLHMGVEGVAWATLIAQTVSAALVVLQLLFTGRSCRMSLRQLRFHREILLETVRIGLPGGLQNAVVSFSNVVVQANINSFGAAAVAGCASYTKIDGFALLPVMSFANAITTFVGQNIGARNYDRVRQGARTCLRMSVGIVAVLSAVLLVFGRQLLRVFSADPEIIHYGVYMLEVLAPFYFSLAIAQTLCGVVRGAGQALVPMIVLVGNFCVVRMIWIAAVMPLMHDILVVYLGYTITWLLAAACMILYYKKVDWLRA